MGMPESIKDDTFDGIPTAIFHRAPATPRTVPTSMPIGQIKRHSFNVMTSPDRNSSLYFERISRVFMVASSVIFQAFSNQLYNQLTIVNAY
jgi:hypothetical protein